MYSILFLLSADIVSLLRWRRMDKKEIIQALESLLKVVPEEVIKVEIE